MFIYRRQSLHTFIPLKHTLILKNVKYLKVLETNQKQVETDRESTFGVKEQHWVSFLFLCFFAWGQSLIGIAWEWLELWKKFSLTDVGNQKRETSRAAGPWRGIHRGESPKYAYKYLPNFWSLNRQQLSSGEPNRIHSLQSVIHKVQDTIQNYQTNGETEKFHAYFSSVVQSCPTLCDPWTAACQASLSITNSQSPPKPMSIELVMPSNHLILCRPLLLLPSVFSSIRVFSNESTLCIRWPKYWSFNFNISPSNEHPGLISFRMNWLDLLAIQGTLKSLLQHHSSKASILQRSAFLIVPTLTSIHDHWKNHSLD